MLQQSDGKLVVSGQTFNPLSGTSLDFALSRYNIDGSLDVSFGANGKVTTDFDFTDPFGGNDDRGYGSALQPDGKIIVVGYSTRGVEIARYAAKNSAPKIEKIVFPLVLDENSAAGIPVGTIPATDDEGDPLNYVITAGNIDPNGNGNRAFTIDSSTGKITVSDSGDLNFEATSQFNLQVTVTDSSGLSDTLPVTINLNSRVVAF